MNARDRFRQIAAGERVGDLFLPLNLNYGWFMEETLERWRGEGLPPEADVREHFGLERIGFMGGSPYTLVPSFRRTVLAEDQDTMTLRDEAGVVQRVFKHGAASKMPQWLEYPVKSRQDFRELRDRLDPRSPKRLPADWQETVSSLAERDYPLGFAPGSFFGHTLQRWVGTEGLCLLFYDNPAFVEEMLEYLEWFFLELAEQYLPRVQFDFASFGEDIAYKGRAFLSPAMFRRFLQPRYVRICERMRSHGIETIFVDSDGCIDELIPLWLDVGVNGFSPLEVAAGEDAVALRRQYGTRIVLVGNIDKRALLRGPDAIRAEATRVRPLLDQGAYFPAVDHSVPPDASYDSFRRLLAELRR